MKERWNKIKFDFSMVRDPNLKMNFFKVGNLSRNCLPQVAVKTLEQILRKPNIYIYEQGNQNRK